jgi:hypothetical protein
LATGSRRLRSRSALGESHRTNEQCGGRWESRPMNISKMHGTPSVEDLSNPGSNGTASSEGDGWRKKAGAVRVP